MVYGYSLPHDESQAPSVEKNVVGFEEISERVDVCVGSSGPVELRWVIRDQLPNIKISTDFPDAWGVKNFTFEGNPLGFFEGDTNMYVLCRLGDRALSPHVRVISDVPIDSFEKLRGTITQLISDNNTFGSRVPGMYDSENDVVYILLGKSVVAHAKEETHFGGMSGQHKDVAIIAAIFRGIEASLSGSGENTLIGPEVLTRAEHLVPFDIALSPDNHVYYDLLAKQLGAEVNGLLETCGTLPIDGLHQNTASTSLSRVITRYYPEVGALTPERYAELMIGQLEKVLPFVQAVEEKQFLDSIPIHDPRRIFIVPGVLSNKSFENYFGLERPAISITSANEYIRTLLNYDWISGMPVAAVLVRVASTLGLLLGKTHSDIVTYFNDVTASSTHTGKHAPEVIANLNGALNIEPNSTADRGHAIPTTARRIEFELGGRIRFGVSLGEIQYAYGNSQSTVLDALKTFRDQVGQLDSQKRIVLKQVLGI